MGKQLLLCLESNMLILSITPAEKSQCSVFMLQHRASVWCANRVSSELFVSSVCDESPPGRPARKTLKQFNDVMPSSDNQI